MAPSFASFAAAGSSSESSGYLCRKAKIAGAFRTGPVAFLSKTEKADGHREELMTASAWATVSYINDIRHGRPR